MHNRPRLLILLAIFMVISPAASLIFNALVVGMPLPTYTTRFFASSHGLEILEFIGLPLLAAACLYWVSPWGYFVTLAVMGWEIFMNTYVWGAQYNNNMMILAAANLVPVLGVVYLLNPSTMRLFLNKKLQWWKTPTRYATKIGNVIAGSTLVEQALISNVSENGAFVENLDDFNVGEDIRISFSLGRYDFTKDAHVVHRNSKGMGIQFVSKSESMKLAIQEENLAPVHPRTVWFQSLQSQFTQELRD